MKKTFIIAAWLLLSLLPAIVYAQDYASQKEKIYIQTNHSFYNVGEAVYFKAYVVRAENNTPSLISNVVYAELISPSGTIAQKGNSRSRMVLQKDLFCFLWMPQEEFIKSGPTLPGCRMKKKAASL